MNTYVYKLTGVEIAETQWYIALALPAALLPACFISSPAGQTGTKWDFYISISTAANEPCPFQEHSARCHTGSLNPPPGSPVQLTAFDIHGNERKQLKVCFLISWEILKVAFAQFCTSFIHLQTDPNSVWTTECLQCTAALTQKVLEIYLPAVSNKLKPADLNTKFWGSSLPDDSWYLTAIVWGVFSVFIYCKWDTWHHEIISNFQLSPNHQ